ARSRYCSDRRVIAADKIKGAGSHPAKDIRVLKDFFPGTKVAVVGLGYVGCVTGACLSSLGHVVIGVDRDEHKVNSVLKGEAPFFEPGLEEMIRENVSAGRYTATTSLADAIADADIALICVGTPSEKNGNL